MDSQLDADVGVIGAGIAGLTAAALLVDRGVRVEVLEQASQLRVTGAGVMLHPNAIVHLDHLQPALAESGTRIAEQVTVDAGGGATVVRWDAVWPGGELPIAIHRRRLADLMLRRLPGDAVRWATRPAWISQDRAGVTVGLPSGARRRYRLLVGADGVHSRTREEVCAGTTASYLGSTYWRTTVERADPFGFPEWRVWRGGGCFFGAMPLGSDRVHVFLQDVVEWPPTRRDDDPARRLRLRAAGIGGDLTPLAAALRLTEPVHVDPALGLVAPAWLRGRIALIGDAAHAVSPATTQGAGLAIEDAGVLAQEIARHGPREPALEAFAERRLARVSAFVRLSRLHTALLPALDRVGSVRRSLEPVDSSAWFGRLYAPLMSPA